MTAADPTAPDLPLHGAAPIDAYLRFWRRYALFTGRASRSEYWWAVLGHVIVVAALGIAGGVLDAIAGALQDAPIAVLPTVVSIILTLLLGAYALALIVPSVAIWVRRLHDADLSGLFLLLVLVPSVGPLILVVLHVLPSNPNGRRFDAGAVDAWQWAPAPPPSAAPAPFVPPAAAAAPFTTPVVDDGVAAPATSPMPIAVEAPAPVTGVWQAAGTTTPVEPPFTADPSWRRQRYVRVSTPGGATVLGTDGVSATEGATALGAGAELWIASTGLAEASPSELGRSWQLAVLAGAARRIAATGVHLPADLEEYGALSMSLTVPGAPADWTGPDGTLGVLLGVGRSDVPDTVLTPRGEVRLVGVAPLRPEELQRITIGGRTARNEIRAALAALPTGALESPDRPAV